MAKTILNTKRREMISMNTQDNEELNKTQVITMNMEGNKGNRKTRAYKVQDHIKAQVVLEMLVYLV